MGSFVLLFVICNFLLIEFLVNFFAKARRKTIADFYGNMRECSMIVNIIITFTNEKNVELKHYSTI